MMHSIMAGSPRHRLYVTDGCADDFHRSCSSSLVALSTRSPTLQRLGSIDIQLCRPANGAFPRFRCSRAVSTLRAGVAKIDHFQHGIF